MRCLGSQEDLEIFFGQKDVSSLLDDPPAGNLKLRHDQSDLKISDKDSFKELLNYATMSNIR